MNTDKKRILVVENDNVDRIAFKRFMKEEPFPYEYVITSSVEDTKRVLESERFAAAVMDYSLGDGTAFDVFDALKGTPLIIATDAGTEEIAVKAIKTGASDYLIKDPEGNYLKILSLIVEIAIKRKQVENELLWYREYLEELVKEHTADLTKANEKLQQEIIERKRVEGGLRQLEKAVEIMQAGVTITDLDGKIIYTNLAEAKMHGYQVEELLGKDVGILAPPELRKPESLEQIKTWKGLARESVNIRRDGSHFPVWLMSGIVKDAEGKPWAIVTSCEDITDRKRAEEALWESKERYRAVVEDMLAMICRFLSDGTLTFVNSEYCKYFNKKHEELIGQNFFQFIPVADQETVRNHFLSLTVENPMITHTHQVVTPDGNIRWQQWTDRALFNEKGELIEYQSLGWDITEEKLAQEERIKLEKRLQQAQKMEAIGTLAGGIAHDFNNILGGIIGYTELIQDHISEDARSQYYLSQTLKACNRAKDLIIQILTFSRQNTSEKQPLQLNSSIKEVLKLLRATLPASIDIRYHAESDSSTILADPTQIQQVLMNLCTNAAHAMREKIGILEVKVQDVEMNADNKDQYPELEPGSYVKLSVNDTGHGMDNEILQRIFEPYFTTKSPDEGTGLGLSVTHGIVRNHGGVIKAQSTPGKGSTFTVFFPMIEPKLVPEKEEYTPGLHGNERILFIDDEEFLVDTGYTMLKQLGYDIVAVMSSQEALELFRSQPDQFDLVITDQTMPKMTGVELAIKLMEIRPDIPIILCTGFSKVITEEQARVLGIRAFVMKPISKKEMARAIRKILDDS